MSQCHAAPGISQLKVQYRAAPSAGGGRMLAGSLSFSSFWSVTSCDSETPSYLCHQLPPFFNQKLCFGNQVKHAQENLKADFSLELVRR